MVDFSVLDKAVYDDQMLHVGWDEGACQDMGAGYICTRPEGHEDLHEACGDSGQSYARW